MQLAHVPCYAPYLGSICCTTWETSGRGRRNCIVTALAAADGLGWSGEAISFATALAGPCVSQVLQRMVLGCDAVAGLTCSLQACPAVHPTQAAFAEPLGKLQAGDGVAL